MKYTLATCFLIIAICLSSCKKDKASSTSLIGTWELQKEVGGFAGSTNYYQQGKGNIRKFTSTHFENYGSGQLVESGSYKIVKNSISGNDQIIFNGDSSPIKPIISIKDNQLMISERVMDGSDMYYVRIQ